MTKPKNKTGSPAPESNIPELIRWIAIFLLVFSAVMAPLISSDHLSIRLLCLTLGTASAFFWLLQAIFEQRLELPWGWHTAGGAILLVAAIASALASDGPQEAIVTMLVWLAYASAFVLAIWIGRNERIRRGLLCTVCAAAVPISVLALLQYAYILDTVNARIESGTLDDVIRSQYSGERKGLLTRTANKRIYSTFTLSNSLAGYLLILMPTLIVLLALAKSKSGKWTLLVVLHLLGLALFFTFSKGGWLVGLILIALFLISLGRKWFARRWALAAGIVVIAAIMLGTSIGLSPTLRTRLDGMAGELGGSARVRTQYWMAGLSMWRTSPVLGIGPGNFKHYYMTHQSVAAEEAQHAHNDYVQILAECGPLALAGYVLFWAAVLIGSARQREELTLPPESPPLQIVLPIAGVLGVMAAGHFGILLRVFDEQGLNNIFNCTLAAVWWVTYRVCWRSIANVASRPLAFGLLLGTLAFVLHSLIDMDFYVEGVGYTACVVAGLAVAPWTRMKYVQMQGAMQLAVAALVSIAGIGLFYGAKRVYEADMERTLGRALAQNAEKEADLTRARKHLKTACEMNPFDHRAFAERATWLQRPPPDLKKAVEAWRKAVTLAPSYADYHSHLSRFLSHLARSDRSLLRPYLEEYRKQKSRLPAGHVRERFVPALVEAALAVELAPNTPVYRLYHAKVLLLAGRRAEAREEFRKALELHAAMIKGRAPGRQLLSREHLKYLREQS